MTRMQQKFYDFYIIMVKEDKKDEAEKLLQDGFAAQDDGSFDTYFPSVKDKYYELIREDCRPILEQAMGSFMKKKTK